MNRVRLLWFLTVIMFSVSPAFGQAQMDVSPPLSVDVLPPPGQTITVPINLDNPNNTPIQAIGLDFFYPDNLLQFEEVDDTGTLTNGWNNIDGQENTSGKIRIGGNHTTPTTASAGVLFNVKFTVLNASGVGTLSLTDFVDDIANATTTNGTINSTVPVELVSFSAEISAQEVTLRWVTASETNNFGFEIEKSQDNQHFEKIGFMAGHGTTTVPQHYAFTDKQVATGSLYYRLRQIDTDGSFDYSGSLKVEISAPQDFALAQNFPNPFNPETTIRYELPQAAFVNMVILNVKGQVIRTLVNQEQGAGFHNIIWNGRDDFGREAASGIYIYRIEAGDFSATRKLTLLR